ncbi:MAG: aspartate aminotransferase family protein, partial [Christensenellaceae bacterium]
PFLEGFVYAKANDTADTLAKIGDRTCAVMVELIQGESGVRPLLPDYVKAIEKVCRERDILLIVDEVQTGNGRTGYLYAYQGYGISPDIVTTAKGLGGGLPIGACLFFDKTEKTLTAGTHGSTFGGNPVACAGAASVLERIDEALLLEVQGKGAYMKANLARIKGVAEVTGMGLMLGLRLREKKAADVAKECAKRGLLVLTAHDRVRIVPALTITKDEMDEGLRILREVIEA